MRRTIIILVSIIAFLSLFLIFVTNIPQEADSSKEVDSSQEVAENKPVPPEIELVPSPLPEPVAPVEPNISPEVEASVFNIENLTIAEEYSATPYNRDLFNHWVSNNSTNCNTRYAVLIIESLGEVTSDGCKVVSGFWLSIYDNVNVSNASDLDIDHMIPLAEAWRSGAYAWDADTRERFSNDLTFDSALVAVTASSNRSKGDRDPAEWLPDFARCNYVTDWVAVKVRWSLTFNPQEITAIQNVLLNCGITSITTPLLATVNFDSSTPPTGSPPAASDGISDPRFSSCAEASRNGFKGPYISGVDVEYGWYRDGDKDGQVCE